MLNQLSTREKNLLLLCAGVLLFMAFAIGANAFLRQRAALSERLVALQNQKRENDTWMADRAFWEKRREWLEKAMPTTDSLGRAQGQLLEELQNQALDLGIAIQQQTLPEAVATPDYREVTVSLRVRGDQTAVLGWLAGMQSPEKFQALKQLRMELDGRAREKTPQTICNLTLARWFKPEGGL